MRKAPVLPPPRRLASRADVYCATAGAALVATAFLVPRILSEQSRNRLFAGAAPIFGDWLPHIGWGTLPAVILAILVIRYGPDLARRLPWRRALALTWLTAIAWSFALAMIDGWQRGFAGRLTTRDEYLHEVPGISDIPAMLHGFSARILDFQPHSWTTHVSGHPPGALLTFVLLDRLGLGGGAWAATLCLLVGSSAAVAVPVAIRALGTTAISDALEGDKRARASLPFLALAPAAVWIAVSADALFAGVTAWAVALLALATRQRPNWVLTALIAGVLFGFGIFLSYGLVLMAVPAAAVLAARTFRPALPALLGVLLVVAAFKAAGFWWLDGYHLVVQRYYQGIASDRPYSYWVWANLAATVCAVGFAPVAAALRFARGLRLETLRGERETPPSPDPFDMTARAASASLARPAAVIAAWSSRIGNWRKVVDPAALLATAGVAAIVLADLSGLSKAETERIWLPFDVWVLAGAALLPVRGVRVWLGVQAVGTLVLVHFILTNW